MTTLCLVSLAKSGKKLENREETVQYRIVNGVGWLGTPKRCLRFVSPRLLDPNKQNKTKTSAPHEH